MQEENKSSKQFDYEETVRETSSPSTRLLDKTDLELVEILLGRIGVKNSSIENLADDLGLHTFAAKEALRVSLANILLLDRKQLDYGSGNISRTGLMGIAVRSSDKVERILNLLRKEKDPSVVGESIEDSLRDLANYATIGLLLIHKRWPNE